MELFGTAKENGCKSISKPDKLPLFDNNTLFVNLFTTPRRTKIGIKSKSANFSNTLSKLYLTMAVKFSKNPGWQPRRYG